MLVNGSFEDPIVTEGTWGLFAVMTGWLSSSVDGFEIWKGLFGPASAGLQNVELDINTPTAISQKIATVVGNVYKVSFDFAARPERNGADNQMNVLVDGTILGTVGADGTGDTQKEWVTYSYAFTAASTSTEVKFSDVGTSNGHGTLLDNTAVCLTNDNVVVTYPVFGYVWNDADQDGLTVPEREVDELSLEGWVVTATDGEQTFSTTTRPNGYYLFNLPEGTWTISDGTPAEWNQTYPINVGNVHVVTVPAVVLTQTDTTNIFAQVLSIIVPTAHAQVFLGYGPFNFGNVFVEGSSSNGNGGSSSGSRRKRTPDAPVPQVLGEATSVMPVGAPNTGAGGASHDATFPSLILALAATRTGLRKAK
jgi:hypothetical protein